MTVLESPVGEASERLTTKQREAVTRRDGSLLITAGAGAGKTSVLVERFVCAVLEDGLPPGRILAITFTDRAAAELRERVRARFQELGEREAARDVENAFLSTFHGFCLRVLRAHPLAAGVDPNFRVLEEGLAGRLRRQAFSSSLDAHLVEHGEPVVDLLAAYGADRVRSMILDIHEELRSRGEREPRLPSATVEDSIQSAAEALSSASTQAAVEVHRALSEKPGARLELSIGKLERALDLLQRSAGTQDNDPPAPGELSELKLPGGAASALAGPGCEAYRTALERYTRVCVDTRAASACELLDGLLERFSRSYAELKRVRGVLDFDDLELQAGALLRREKHIRESWSERFQMLMVNEFQDSNQRQLEILTALERENLCVVGDELQAIYGFRHADVSLFRERRGILAERDGTVTLAHNFRGRASLLHAINAVFSRRFGDQYTALIPGREEPQDDNDEPLLELLLSDKRAHEQPDRDRFGCQPATADDPQTPPAVAAWRWAEAQMLAGRVADLIETSAVKPGEVVVLLRALGDVGVYERALASQGVATIAAVGGFWSHQQVGDLLCYLRALANPLDELSLISTLACPLVGVSSDGLASLTRAARSAGCGLWETVAAIDEHPDASLTPRERASLARFSDHFSRERANAPRRPIAQLIERAVAFSDYERHILEQDWGQRRLANVHKLTRLAHLFEAEEGRDLRGFLDHVAELQDGLQGGEPDAPVADEEPSAVRLMSIHAAKGLEFPVVCLPDLGRAPNLRAQDLLVDPSRDGGGMGLRLVSLDGSESMPALDYQRLLQRRRAAEALEEQRIIYVAMTRARERLLLSAAVDFENWPADTFSAPSIGWLAPALLPDLSALLDGDQQTTVQQVPDGDGARVRCWVRRGDESLPFTAHSSARLSQGTDDRPTLEGSGQTGATRTHGQLSLPGMHTADAVARFPNRPRTLTYSSLAKFERCGYRYYLEDVLGLPERQEKTDGHGGMRGRSRGQIVHRLLERIDYRDPQLLEPSDVLATAAELALTVGQGEGRELAALLAEMMASELAKRLATALWISREQPFAFAPRGIEELATGTLDLSARDRDGGWLVVDYKSDRVGQGEDLEGLVRRKYATQRLLYGLAALHGGAPTVEVVHWFLERPRDWVSVHYRASERDRLEGELLDRTRGLRSEGFNVSRTPHRELCAGCAGRRGLCSWEETETMRDRPEE